MKYKHLVLALIFALIDLFAYNSLFAQENTKSDTSEFPSIQTENFVPKKVSIDANNLSDYDENVHIKKKLSDEEKQSYYKNPIGYIENIAQNDWQRALELSLYYQGWPAHTIFYRFDWLMYNNFFNWIPTTEDMRLKNRKMRDANKALYWGKYAQQLLEKNAELNRLTASCFFPVLENLSTIYLESENTEEFEKIKRLKRALNKEYGYELQAPSEWRNLYCGFLYCQNRELSMRSLFRYYRNEIKYAECLAMLRITSGFYDEKSYSVAEYSYWKRNFEKEQSLLKEKVLEFWNAKPAYSSYFISDLMRYSIENPSEIFRNDSRISIKNSHYNFSKAIEEVNRVLKDYENSEDKKSSIEKETIELFIVCAPKYGIKKTEYDSIMKIIRANKSFFKYYLEQEKSAREWFSGRIPDFAIYN